MLQAPQRSYSVDDAAEDKGVLCFSNKFKQHFSFNLDQRQTRINLLFQLSRKYCPLAQKFKLLF